MYNNSDYKLKHIVSLNKDLMNEKFFNFNFENELLLGRIIYVASEIIEFNTYIWDEELNNTTNVDYDLLNEVLNEIYEFFTLDFDEDKLSGNINVKNLGTFQKYSTNHILFKEIENNKDPLAIKFKYLILTEYESTININKDKLIEKEINYEKELMKRDELLKEIKKMEEEKNRKKEELKELLNKPKKKPDYLKSLRY